MFTMLSVPHVNQVHVFYRAQLLDLDFGPGTESLEVALFREDRIPWKDLAFRNHLHDPETLLRRPQDRRLSPARRRNPGSAQAPGLSAGIARRTREPRCVWLALRPRANRDHVTRAARRARNRRRGAHGAPCDGTR